MKRFIAIFVLCTLLNASTISCMNNDANKTNAPISDTSAPPTEETADDGSYTAVLPDKKYDGYSFTFLKYYYGGSLWEPRDLWCEAADGDLINDAVYKRNLTVAEQFGVEIKEVSSDDYTNMLIKSVSSGEDAYGSVQLFLCHIPTLILGGKLLEASKLSYLDFDKKYWDKNIIEPLTIAEKTFLFNGDINISDNDASGILMFNKRLAAEHNTGNLYNLVKSGEWTLDKFSGLIKGVSADIDGDSEMTYKDKWGLICQYDSMSSFLTGTDGGFAQKDGEDLPALSFYNDKNIAACVKIFNVMYDEQNSFNIQKLTGVEGDVKNYSDAMFNEDRALLYWVRMRQLEDYRAMNADFGLLPMPKYDEAQKNYITEINVFIGTALAVPKTSSDPERTSVILEALAEQSHKYLTPAYYDSLLQSKVSRDDESNEMLDIIMSNEKVDIGEVYAFGTLANSFVLLAKNNDTNVASLYEKLREKAEKDITMMIEAFKKADGA